MKLLPLNKRVVVKQFEEEQISKSGLVVVTDKARGKKQLGIVVAVAAPEAPEGGEDSAIVCVGDKVLFGKYVGTEYVDDETSEELLIVEQSDLLAIVKS